MRQFLALFDFGVCGRSQVRAFRLLFRASHPPHFWGRLFFFGVRAMNKNIDLTEIFKSPNAGLLACNRCRNPAISMFAVQQNTFLCLGWAGSMPLYPTTQNWASDPEIEVSDLKDVVKM